MEREHCKHWLPSHALMRQLMLSYFFQSPYQMIHPSQQWQHIFWGSGLGCCLLITRWAIWGLRHLSIQRQAPSSSLGMWPKIPINLVIFGHLGEQNRMQTKQLTYYHLIKLPWCSCWETVAHLHIKATRSNIDIHLEFYGNPIFTLLSFVLVSWGKYLDL